MFGKDSDQGGGMWLKRRNKTDYSCLGTVEL